MLIGVSSLQTQRRELLWLQRG